MDSSRYGMGRSFVQDQRDGAYPARSAVPRLGGAGYYYLWDNGAWLDQGPTGTCVSHAWSHWVEDSPILPSGTIDPFALYAELVLHDPWPENDAPDWYFGSTIRAGAKALQARGVISEYRWAWDVETIIDAVLNRQPVVVGTNWYEAMFDPAPVRYGDGASRYTLELQGPVVGGHAWVINGVNTNTDPGIFRMKNSWGRFWGIEGRAVIRIEDMRRLLAEDGEACIALQV